MAELRGVDLHANCRGLLAADYDLRHARDLRHLQREPVLSIVVNLRDRQIVGGDAKNEDWRIGRVHLAVGWRIRQIFRQLAGRCIDRGLNILGCRVDISVQVKLNGDLSGAEKARGCRSFCVTPGMIPICFSSGVATAEAITSGLAPGSCAVTWMVGKSTVGSVAHRKATDRLQCQSTAMAIISSDVAIGRADKGSREVHE